MAWDFKLSWMAGLEILDLEGGTLQRGREVISSHVIVFYILRGEDLLDLALEIRRATES